MVGKYKMMEVVGVGSFGKVYRAVNQDDNKEWALKVLDKAMIEKANMLSQVKRELGIMLKVRHKYVIYAGEVIASTKKIFIVTEYLPGGTIMEKVEKHGKFSDEKARFYFRQLIEGIQFLHKKGVCHRDLKPANLLLDSNANLKICDFGFATYVFDPSISSPKASILQVTPSKYVHIFLFLAFSSNPRSQTSCGTPFFMAPEILSKKGYFGMHTDIHRLLFCS